MFSFLSLQQKIRNSKKISKLSLSLFSMESKKKKISNQTRKNTHTHTHKFGGKNMRAISLEGGGLDATIFAPETEEEEEERKKEEKEKREEKRRESRLYVVLESFFRPHFGARGAKGARGQGGKGQEREGKAAAPMSNTHSWALIPRNQSVSFFYSR